MTPENQVSASTIPRYILAAALTSGIIAGIAGALIGGMYVKSASQERSHEGSQRNKQIRFQSPVDTSAIPLPQNDAHISVTPSTAPLTDASRHDVSSVVGAAEPQTSLVRKIEQSIATINGRESYGSGFLTQLNSSSPVFLVTNSHVIEREYIQDISVSFESDGEFRHKYPSLNLRVDSKKFDLALIEIRTNKRALQLRDHPGFVRGEDIIIIGNPCTNSGARLTNAVSRGVMSSETTLRGINYYQATVAANPGNSGGPVVGMAGDVLGILSSKIAGKESLAFCVPLETLKSFLRLAESSRSDQTMARHDLRCHIHEMKMFFNAYECRVGTCEDAMEIFTRRGRPSVKGSVQMKPVMLSGTSWLKESISRSFARFDSAPHTYALGDEMRKQCESLRRCIYDIRILAETPTRYSFETYRRRRIEISNSFNLTLRSLIASLDE